MKNENEVPQVDFTEKESSPEKEAYSDTIEVLEAEKELPIQTVRQRQEKTRGLLAIIFLIGFFLLLIGAAVVGFYASDVDRLENIKESLLTVSGILSGPLGFVIGYYFRQSEEGSVSTA